MKVFHIHYVQESKSDSPREIIQMAKTFYPFFRKELHMMSSKYDLYFIYATMRKVMLIYKHGIGEVSRVFFGDPPCRLFFDVCLSVQRTCTILSQFLLLATISKSM